MKNNHHTPSEITRWLKRQEKSGLSVRAFAQRHQLALSTFYKWKKDQRASALDKERVDLLELSVLAPTENAYCELTLTNGRRLRFPVELAPSYLQNLLGVLEADH